MDECWEEFWGDEGKSEEKMEGEAPEEIENHDLKDKYISELVCDIIEFHDNMGGTSEDILENLHFKGDPELFKEVASTLLLRSLPTNLSSLVEEFVTGLPDFETWCQAQDSVGVQAEARETENYQRDQR